MGRIDSERLRRIVERERTDGPAAINCGGGLVFAGDPRHCLGLDSAQSLAGPGGPDNAVLNAHHVPSTEPNPGTQSF